MNICKKQVADSVRIKNGRSPLHFARGTVMRTEPLVSVMSKLLDWPSQMMHSSISVFPRRLRRGIPRVRANFIAFNLSTTCVALSLPPVHGWPST